jgi:SAM-dependent methyltransferase
MTRRLASSFRDPSGRLVLLDGRAIRFVNTEGRETFQAAWESPSVREFMERGRIVASRVVESDEAEQLRALAAKRGLDLAHDVEVVLEHEHLVLPTYPYEWSPQMLYEAGILTLDLSEALLAEGLGLKDATPYNVLYRGHSPVFIDFLSIERRNPHDATWLPYAQFVRTFILPLIASREFGISLNQIFSVHRDGLEPDQLYKLCGPVQRFWRPYLTLVTIPHWLSGSDGAGGKHSSKTKETKDPERARYVLGRLFRHLRKQLARAAPTGGAPSAWSEYTSSGVHTEEYVKQKLETIENVLAKLQPDSVLDVGCNTGDFSVVAARHGARVVAIDADPAVVGRVWTRAREEGLDVQPLVADMSRPSPWHGWRNSECVSLLDRLSGSVELVLMLAVIHHLLVSERIPLDEILELAADLTTRWAIVEYVSPEDPMFRHLARGRDALHANLDQALFEEVCQRHFTILESHLQPGGHRRVYVLEKRRG